MMFVILNSPSVHPTTSHYYHQFRVESYGFHIVYFHGKFQHGVGEYCDDEVIRIMFLFHLGSLHHVYIQKFVVQCIVPRYEPSRSNLSPAPAGYRILHDDTKVICNTNFSYMERNSKCSCQCACVVTRCVAWIVNFKLVLPR